MPDVQCLLHDEAQNFQKQLHAAAVGGGPAGLRKCSKRNSCEQTPLGCDQGLSLTAEQEPALSQGVTVRTKLANPLGTVTLFQDIYHRAQCPLHARTSPGAQSCSAGHRLVCRSTSPASYFLANSKLSLDYPRASLGDTSDPPLPALMRQRHHRQRLYWGDTGKPQGTRTVLSCVPMSPLPQSFWPPQHMSPPPEVGPGPSPRDVSEAPLGGVRNTGQRSCGSFYQVSHPSDGES